MTSHQDDKCDDDEIVFVFICYVAFRSFQSLPLRSSQDLICAGTVQYGVPSLVEAVRRTSSSWCHNGGTLFICNVQNITKMSNCTTPDALLKLRMHQNLFSAGAVLWTPLGVGQLWVQQRFLALLTVPALLLLQISLWLSRCRVLSRPYY